MILRPAQSRDAADLLAWRNDPLTREMSRSAGAVTPEQHQAWFAAVLEGAEVTLLIGESEGVKVGMVRLDHGPETEVSINVNPACRGRGYGEALLTLALARVERPVFAEIKPENLASQRLFERVGFRFLEMRDGLRRYRLDRG